MTLERQRVFRQEHADDLMRKMLDGRFRTGLIGIARRRNGNGALHKVMVNGYHQIPASIKGNVSFFANVEEFDCDTEADVGLLYDQYDVHRFKSLRDMLKVEMGILKLNWPVKFVELLVVGAAKKEGIEGNKKEERKKLLRKYLPEGRQLLHLIMGFPMPVEMSRTRHLMRGPVFDAMLRTLEKNEGDFRRFWVAVRDGENLTREMPEYKIREFLRSATFYKGRTSMLGPGANITSGHEMTYRCIIAWNAFRRGRSTNLAYRRGKPIPDAV